MLDLRYHLASLAAVFVAIAVGIVIGVAIASGGGVDDATKALQESQIRALNDELEAVRERAGRSEEEEQAMRELVERAYPALVAGRLADRAVAIVFLGPIDAGVRPAVERTLVDAGAEAPLRVVALDLPVDLEAVDELLLGDPALAPYAGLANVDALGAALARELVAGGETPFLDTLAPVLVVERSGALSEPADAVVVARSWVPEETDDPVEEGRQNQNEALVYAALRGLEAQAMPVVGAETSDADPSAIGLYRRLGLASVDHVDTITGRVALAVLLAGGEGGHYGTKPTAEAALPPVPPVAPSADGTSQ